MNLIYSSPEALGKKADSYLSTDHILAMEESTGGTGKGLWCVFTFSLGGYVYNGN